MKKAAFILGATLFGIFTGVANAGSPIALTESEMDAVTAGVGFTSNTSTTMVSWPVWGNRVWTIEDIEERIVEKKALSFPSLSAVEEYRQTLDPSELTESMAFVITGPEPAHNYPVW